MRSYCSLAGLDLFLLRSCYTDLLKLCVLVGAGPEDNVADYYQQQVEMLEGFTEMDELAERGFVPGMSKV